MKISAKIFAEEHIIYRVNWINNVNINQSMYFDLPATVERTRNWYYNKDNGKRIDLIFFGELEEPISMGGFTNIDYLNSHAEFYIMVNPILQGRGYGTRVAKWIFNYGFIKYDLNKICLFTNDGNKNAYKLYENCGFKLEGILRNHKFKNGYFHNRRIYGLLKDEWKLLDWKKNEIEYH